MTQVIETPNAGESFPIGNIDLLERTFIKVKDVHGINVFVSPQNGHFFAKFSQTAEVKWFERPSLAELEKLITAAVYPFSGHVEVIKRPEHLIHERDITDLTEGFESDEEVKKKRGYRTYRFTPKRDSKVLTGVVRREYHQGSTTVLFKTESDGTQTMQEGYVHPDAALDQQYFNLAQLYLVSQVTWRDRFQQIIDQYQPFSINEIVDELRAQGARAPRH